MEKLPIGPDLELSQKKFKKYFSGRFEFKGNESFDEFLEKGIPEINYEYVATVFFFTR